MVLGARPHQKVTQVLARIGGESIVLGEMAYLRTQCRFMVLMPQWDFLNFLTEQGRRYPTFHLRMQTEVRGLIEENGRIIGVRGNTPAGPVEIRADLVVGADGRNSTVRDCSGLPIENIGNPMDSLQLRLSKYADDPELSSIIRVLEHRPRSRDDGSLPVCDRSGAACEIMGEMIVMPG